MITQSRQHVSKIVQALLESAGARTQDIATFMQGSAELDVLFSQQNFLLKKWSIQKRQKVTSNAKNSPLSKNMNKTMTASSPALLKIKKFTTPTTRKSK